MRLEGIELHEDGSYSDLDGNPKPGYYRMWVDLRWHPIVIPENPTQDRLLLEALHDLPEGPTSKALREYFIEKRKHVPQGEMIGPYVDGLIPWPPE